VSHPGVLVRAAAPHEISEIEAVCVAAYSEYRSEVPLSVFEAYVADLRRLSDHWHEAEVLVAEVGGHIGGSVLLYADASTEGFGLPQSWFGFGKLAVHPRMRGRGLGRSLTQACIDSARRRGAPTLGMHTALFMRVARRIYEHTGFRRCAEFDLKASDIGLGGDSGDVSIIAYRLDFLPA
jgi:predicted N-acetyltransferase YhbS